MIIDNLDLFGVGAGPKETDAQLVVYSDRALAAPIPFESLQTLTRWQIEKSLRRRSRFQPFWISGSQISGRNGRRSVDVSRSK
jgi:hypothetical protein